MNFRRSTLIWAAILAAFSTVNVTFVYGQTYDVNAAFLANETPNGGEVNPFGPFTYGYNLTPGTPGTFSTAGLSHTDAFNGVANVEGYFIPNNVLVPAVLQNTTNAANVTNFGVTLDPYEILLHPGGLGGDGFVPPYADGVLRFTVPQTAIYDIEGEFRSLSTGTTDSRVLLNGIALADVDDGGAFSILGQQLSAGDFLDFAVGAAGDGIGSDSTGLRATITVTPEPATWSTWMVCGLTGFGAAWWAGRRRKKNTRRN